MPSPSAEVVAQPIPVPAGGAAVVPPALPGAARQAAVLTFVAAVMGHMLADFMGTSVWAVYKNLANLDLAKAGLIATAIGMIGTAMQPLFGLMADRYGRRRIILLGTLLTAFALLLGPLTPLWPAMDRSLPAVLGLPGSYLVMFAILLVGRIGQDLFHPAGAGLAGSFSRRRGATFLAIFIAVGSIGYGLSQIGFSVAFDSLGGHTEVLLLPAAAMWVLIWLWCRPIDSSARGKRESLVQSLARLRHAAWHIFVLFLILAMSAAVLIGLYFLMPEFAEQRGYPEWIGKGGAFGLIVLGSTLFMVPMGHLADRFGRRRALILMMILSAISYNAIVRLTLPVPAFVALCIVGGAFMGTVNPLGVSFGQRLAPESISIVSAVLMGWAWCLGNLSPSVVGYFAKAYHDPATVLMWLGVLNVIMVGLGLLLPKGKAA